MRKIKNKVAVITGGNSGIGLATAKLFVAHGATVIVNARTEKRLEESKELEKEGITVIKADVSIKSDLENAKLVNLSLDSMDSAIESSMKTLVEFFDADRCHLGKISDDQPKNIVSYFKRYYEIVSKAAFSQAFLRLPGCVVHSAQANRPKEVSHV
jgi:NAD(P)-dependent dehydrogenase (short-subunit alcohol dehydrogenase family)